MKKTVKTIIESIMVKNPDTVDNSRYLFVEVLEAQGVRLYPHQREKMLSDEVASPETIMRARRSVKQKLIAEQQARQKSYYDKVVANGEKFARTSLTRAYQD